MLYFTRRFFYVLTCVILFLCFSVLLALRLPRLGKRELILVLFVRLFDLRLFGFVCFLFLLVSGKGCGLWLWHSLDFSLTFLFLLRSVFPLHRWLHSGETVICAILLYTGNQQTSEDGYRRVWMCLPDMDNIYKEQLQDTDLQCVYQVVSGANCRQRNVVC